MKIGIIGAMEDEIAIILAAMKSKKERVPTHHGALSFVKP